MLHRVDWYTSTDVMLESSTSKESVDVYQSTRCNKGERFNLQNHHSDYLKSDLLFTSTVIRLVGGGLDGRGTARHAIMSRVRFPFRHFSLTWSFRPHYGPWGRLSL
jgi:hypothetical protein